MLPIVAATMSRRIEGCFGSAAARIVSAVMLGLPDVVISTNLFDLLIAAHAEVRAVFPPISGGSQAASPIHRSQQR